MVDMTTPLCWLAFIGALVISYLIEIARKGH